MITSVEERDLQSEVIDDVAKVGAIKIETKGFNEIAVRVEDTIERFKEKKVLPIDNIHGKSIMFSLARLVGRNGKINQ